MSVSFWGGLVPVDLTGMLIFSRKPLQSRYWWTTLSWRSINHWFSRNHHSAWGPPLIKLPIIWDMVSGDLLSQQCSLIYTKCQFQGKASAMLHTFLQRKLHELWLSVCSTISTTSCVEYLHTVSYAGWWAEAVRHTGSLWKQDFYT